MVRILEDYRDIVGVEAIYRIHEVARRLYGRHVVHINSTFQGGGVAEILSALVPLMNDVGVETGWRILHGHPDFFSVTKKFHNALQGDRISLSPIKQRLHVETNERFSIFTHINHDCIIVHDPQPLPLVTCYHKRQPWVWRCHVDLSNPDEQLWKYLSRFVLRYDRVVVSLDRYRRPDLPVPQAVIRPAIDPLSPKNVDVPDTALRKALTKFRVPLDKPLVVQISRFDKWKDPLGVIEAIKRVRQAFDCRLVLCGSMATDDPEGNAVYEQARRRAAELIDSGDVILLTAENNILVNALQRAAAVVVQNSRREGFGLTVTEALWKARPVVATNVGGIALQIEDGVTGRLVEPNDPETLAASILELLQDPERAKELGERGRQRVREEFLITRLLLDYLQLLEELLG